MNERFNIVTSPSAREIPIVTGEATYTPERISTFIKTNKANALHHDVALGLQVGIGAFPSEIVDVHTNRHWVRPFQRGRTPGVSVEKALQNINEVRDSIWQVTVKIGAGSDENVLRETIAGLERIIPRSKAIVISSLDPDLLLRYKDTGVRADVWQQIIRGKGLPSEEMARLKRKQEIVPDAELCFASPDIHDEQKRINEQQAISEFLASGGHDAYMDISGSVRNSIAFLGEMNFHLNATGNKQRVRGFYVADPSTKIDRQSITSVELTRAAAGE